ncbi:MAG: L-rhamnose/proton symporter RhaT [Acidobacteriota bacterium]
MENFLLGLVLIFVGGILLGTFILPMKYVQGWRWENQWIVYSLVALLFMPWALGFASVPGFLEVLQSLPLSVLAAPVLFGVAWGVGGTCFGICVPMVGMAIAYSVDLGLMTAIGTMTPLVVNDRGLLGTSQGLMIQAGVALVLVGVVFTALAGRARESSDKKSSAPVSKKVFWTGLVFAVLAGVFSPFINFAFAFGDPILKRATEAEASPALAVNAVWAVALLGGFIVNAGYALWLLYRNRSWSFFASGWGRNGLLSATMGFMWMGSTFLYGLGASFLGSLGASVGWAMYLIVVILAANLTGVFTGEWKGASGKPVYMMAAAVVLLVIASLVIAGAR